MLSVSVFVSSPVSVRLAGCVSSVRSKLRMANSLRSTGRQRSVRRAPPMRTGRTKRQKRTGSRAPERRPVAKPGVAGRRDCRHRRAHVALVPVLAEHKAKAGPDQPEQHLHQQDGRFSAQRVHRHEAYLGGEPVEEKARKRRRERGDDQLPPLVGVSSHRDATAMTTGLSSAISSSVPGSYGLISICSRHPFVRHALVLLGRRLPSSWRRSFSSSYWTNQPIIAATAPR